MYTRLCYLHLLIALYICRYAYSEDGSDEFDKDDTLTLIKPSPLPMGDSRSPDVRQIHGGNGLSNDDSEEDKTE